MPLTECLAVTRGQAPARARLAWAHHTNFVLKALEEDQANSREEIANRWRQSSRSHRTTADLPQL